MDRLHTMSIFLAVVDEGGFAPAARKLNISPPVVTRAVAELEQNMGVRLLSRTTRVVRATEAGTRFAEDCRRILVDVAEAERAAAGTHAVPRGRLVLTAPVMFGRLHVAPIVTDYLRRYPETEVDCRFLDRVVNLMDEGVDIAIRLSDLPDSSYQAIGVGKVRQVVCAAPAYLKAHGMPQHPEDLARHTIVMASGVTSSPDWRFHRRGQPLTVRVSPRLTVTSNDAAIAAVESGFGIGRLISYMVANHVADGSLVPVLAAYEPPPVPISVLHHEGRHSSGKVRAFVDLAVSALRASAALR
jgi:DNA-binding transcriptional LysR family regulator